MAAAEQPDSNDEGNLWACFRGNLLLSSTVVFVNQKTQKRLRKAVFDGDVALANQLLHYDAGCSVHEIDNGGKTVLHYAAGQGNVELVDLLIKHGADVNSQSDAGEMPMDEAVYWAEKCQCSREYFQTIDLLLEHGGMHSNVTRYLKYVQSRARLDKKAEQTSTASSSADCGWRRSFDHASGRVYYVNIWTGKSQWEEPAGG